MIARSHDKLQSRELGTLDEFRARAYKTSPAYGWMSFLLVLIGLLLETIAHGNQPPKAA